MSGILVRVFLSETDLIICMDDAYNNGTVLDQLYEPSTESIGNANKQIEELWGQQR